VSRLCREDDRDDLVLHHHDLRKKREDALVEMHLRQRDEISMPTCCEADSTRSREWWSAPGPYLGNCIINLENILLEHGAGGRLPGHHAAVRGLPVSNDISPKFWPGPISVSRKSMPVSRLSCGLRPDGGDEEMELRARPRAHHRVGWEVGTLHPLPTSVHSSTLSP